MNAAKRKWLFVLPWGIQHIGGVNQVVVNLFRQINNGGFYQSALLVASGSASSTGMIGGSQPLHMDVKAPYPGGGAWALLSYALSLPRSLMSLRKLLLGNNTEVVNIHAPNLGSLTFVILRMLGLYSGKIILSFHGFDVRQAAGERGIRRCMWRLIAMQSDAVVAVSEDSRQEIVALWPSARCVKIHNGIDPEFFFSQRDRSFDIPPDLRCKILLLSIGTLERKKGHDVLLRAFQTFANDFANVHLVIAGRDGEHRQPLDVLISQLGLDGRVTLLVDLPHSRIGALLERATLFVLPSRSEPFGITLLEAGLFGLPVIASSVGGIPEIIVNNESGRSVPADRPEELARSIVELLNDPERRKRLGANLHVRVHQSFNWVTAYQSYQSIVAA